MGANQSGGVSIGGSSMGYQVLRVYPDSPGSQAGLKAYFDFIIAIGNTRFNKEDGSLREILKASVDQTVKMIVYNTRSKTAREVDVTPTTSWGGSGLLGVSIKHSSFDRADERVWHVVEVDPGSPAHQAGFKANEDFVIGSDSVLQENDDLYNLIEAHENRALKLFVYNTMTDNCREVVCNPNSKWGGRGYLGCEFGHGLLHRIPYADSQNATSAGPNSPVTDPRQPLLLGSQQHQPQQQQAPAQQQHQQQPRQPASTFQNQSMLQSQRATNQPGYQLLHQALFDKSSMQSSALNNNTSSNQSTDRLPPPPPVPSSQAPQHQQQAPPQVPQTFAQLANAQYQVSHNQQQPEPQQQKVDNHQQTQQQMSFNQQQPQTPVSPTVQNNSNAISPPLAESSQYPKFDQQTAFLQQQHQPPQSYNNLISSDDKGASNNRSITPPPKAPPIPTQLQQQQQPQSLPPPQLQPQQPYQYFATQQPIDQFKQQQQQQPMNQSGSAAFNFSQQTLPPPPTMYQAQQQPLPPPPMMPPTQQQQPQPQSSSPVDQLQQQQHQPPHQSTFDQVPLRQQQQPQQHQV